MQVKPTNNDSKTIVVDVVKKILKSLEIPGDEGRKIFMSTLAPRGLAIHARQGIKPREATNHPGLSYEDFPEGFADRIPWNGGQKMIEGLDGEPTVMVDHDVGMVWVPYWFTNDGELTHVGTNIFTLVKRDWRDDGEEQWLIVSMTDTARRPSDEDKEKHRARS